MRPTGRRRPRAFAATILAAASLLTACERGTCTFLGSPPYVIPRIAQGGTLEYEFSVYAKSDAVSGGDLKPAVVEFLLRGAAADFLAITPNPIEIDPTQRGLVTLTALRTAAPGEYRVEAVCRPRGIHNGESSAEFVVTVDEATFFSIAATPARLVLDPNEIGSVRIDMLREAGFHDPVLFTVDGTPPGAAVGINAGPTTGPTAGLNISAGSAAPGTYTLTVNASAAGRVRTANVAVEILAPEVETAWSMSVEPMQITIPPGGSGQLSVSLGRANFPNAVTFFVDFLPATFPIDFAPKTTIGNAAVITISVPPGTPPGLLLFQVRAEANAPLPFNERAATVMLTIGTE